MKVTFALKQDTLDTADIIRAKINRPLPKAGSIVESCYDIDAESQSEAFDKAAIEFAKEWLTVEYQN